MCAEPLFRRVPPMHALAAFKAAVRLGGFASAADQLCVTPCAVRDRIRGRQQQLDTQSFERAGSGVRLTSSARLSRARAEVAGSIDWLHGCLGP